MKFEGTVKGEWYQVTGDMFSSTSDFICFHSQNYSRVYYTSCVDGGAFEREEGDWTISKIDGDKLTPMTQTQKEEYLPQYKPRGLGWCRTENKGQYIHVTKIKTNFSYYDKYIEENVYKDVHKEEGGAWVISSNTYACPLTEDEIEEFITPYLPKEESDLEFAYRTYTPGKVVESLFQHAVEVGIPENVTFIEDSDNNIYFFHPDGKSYVYEGMVWATVSAETNLEKAKRLYPVGTKFISLGRSKKEVLTITHSNDPLHLKYWAGSGTVLGSINLTGTGAYLFNNGKWAEIIESPNLNMTGLPDAHIENLHNSVKEFLVGDEPPTLPLEGAIYTVSEGGIRWQQPHVSEPVIIVDDSCVVSYSMNIIDFSDHTLSINKKRGSEIIEIFIKK